jgi:hypothetical protein
MRNLVSRGHLNGIPQMTNLPKPRNPKTQPQAVMELEESKGDQQESSGQAGRPPPVILTSATNLLELQKKLRGIVKGIFEFRNSKSRTRVAMKEMADFLAIKSY